jgi:hypothetical protein
MKETTRIYRGRRGKRLVNFYSERFTRVVRVVTEESGGLSTTRSV